MTHDAHAEAVRRYFAPPARWPLACLVAGAVLPLAGDMSALAAGASLAVVTAGALLLHTHLGVPDESYDRARDALLGGVVSSISRDAWGLDASGADGGSPCVHVCAPPARPGRAAAWRRGRDGTIRFNPVRLLVVGFGEHRLHACSGELDLLTGRMVTERTIECPYDAVTGVATRLGRIRVVSGGATHQLDDVESLVLAIADREALEVPLRSPRWARLLGGGELPSLQADAAISRIRTVVRQKKRARIGG